MSCWVPRVGKDMVLSTVAEEGELDSTKVEHSKWVSTMMNSFYKMVGFPIVKHEAQCVVLRKILTTNNLQKMCIIFLYWCYMCKRCGELVDHLLLHCPIAYELWSSLFFLFGIHWVMPHRVIDCLSLGRVSSVEIAI